MNKITSLLIIIMLVSAMAIAKNVSSGSYPSRAPMEFEADSIFYNKTTQQIYAKGNVYLFQDEQLIHADEIVYQSREGKIYARGNVALKKSDSSVFFADEAIFDESSQDGIALDFKARINKKSLIFAKSGELQGNNHIKLNELVYSPCKICENNVRRNMPLWQVTANSGELNKADERLYFKDATIEFLGAPIFYTPYFVAPSPGAQRKTGFLMPKYKYNTVFGNAVTIPFYINTAPHYDFTYSPTFFKQQIIHQLGHRRLLQHGVFTLNTSFLSRDKLDIKGKMNQYTRKARRMHYKIHGHYAAKREGIFGGHLDFKSARVHDKTKDYLKKYQLDDSDYLVTDIKYMNYHHDNYYSNIRMLQFQDLRAGYNAKTTPLALPIIDGYYEKELPILNTKAYTEYNTLYLKRAQGTSYKRFSFKPGFYTPLFLDHGSIIKLNSFVRTDFYNVDKKAVTVPLLTTVSASGKQGDEARIIPEISAEWNLPVYNYISGYSVVLEPVATAAYSAQATNLNKVSNEDSMDPEINSGNLLSTNKYSGYDKVESGPRANLGFRASISSQYFDNITLFLGQSFRKNPDINFSKVSGLQGKNSDYVAKINIIPLKNFMLINSTRLDRSTTRPLRNEFTASATMEKYNLNLMHVYSDTNLLYPNTQTFKQEYIANGEYLLFDEWWVKGAIHGRLGKGSSREKASLISDSISLKYTGDCLNAEIGISRDYTKTTNLKPSSTFIYTISIPTF